jgi:hypothetical protein
VRLPEGTWFHGFGLRLGPGEELPEELLARLPDGHPLKARTAQAPAEHRSRRTAEER